MSRGVKDLRDLICVSRLTIRESDDETLFSDEEFNKGIQHEQNVDQLKSFSNKSVLISTPDSGFITNEHPASDSQNSDGEISVEFPNHVKTQKFPKEVLSKAVRNDGKRKLKSRPPQKSASAQPVSKVLNSQFSSPQKGSNQLRNELLSVSHRRVDTGAVGDRSDTPSADFAEGRFETLLTYIDGSVVSDWLEQSNRNVNELTAWCHSGDNFVQFAHFWISSFTDKEKFDIFRLEYSILVDQLSFAFASGLNCGVIQRRHLSMFLDAVYREYPAKLMSSRGAYLFLDILDILSSSKQLHYRQLLSDVRCSSRRPQHIQWILATRSFALVSVWFSVVNFYRKLDNSRTAYQPSPSSDSIGSDNNDFYVKRMLVAIRYGFADVVHYLLKSGKIPPNPCDAEQKSLIFYAVMHKHTKILQLLLSQTDIELDVNRPARNGNTPLHAATNGGCRELVQELLKCSRISVNVRNLLCDNATPLHLAILHGHLEIVRLLLSNGADRSMKMADLTAHALAEQFGHNDIAELLSSSD